MFHKWSPIEYTLLKENIIYYTKLPNECKFKHTSNAEKFKGKALSKVLEILQFRKGAVSYYNINGLILEIFMCHVQAH